MFGTAPNMMGGISSVINTYMSSGLFQRHSVVYISSHIDGNFIKKILIQLKSYILTLIYLIIYKINIFHIHSSSRKSFWRKSFFILVGKLFKKKIIFHLHGGEFKKFYEDELNYISKTIAHKILNMPEVIITLSPFWKNWMEKNTEQSNIVYIPNSVFIPTPKKKYQKIYNQILFLGLIKKEKGIYDLIQALSLLKKNNNSFILKIGGVGETESLKELINQNNLSDNVKLLGWITDDNKEKELLQSSIFVLPSYYECMPISILEAMSFGIPTIATDVGGIPEQISDGIEGYLIKPGDINGLYNHLVTLLNDQKIYKQMSDSSLSKFNHNFSIPKIIPQIEQIYKDLNN
jgi:glycosyltransferase involved in cell wall biosynthesis